MKRFGLSCITLAAFLFLTLVTTTLQAQTVQYCAASAFGYGKSATGGGNATPTLVNSESALKSALGGSNKVIIITQNITLSGNQIGCSKSNITLMALPGVKLISTNQSKDKSGILSFSGSNIILRNLTFVGPGAYDIDGNDNLTLSGAKNVWVDHCDFQDGMDGNFDINGNADNITITWCRFRYFKDPTSGGSGGANDHRFTNLIGSDSGDKPADGTYNITYAYCWWDEGCRERMPRVRNASLHLINCYWNSSVANYYVGPENADCRFEGCTFEGAPKTAKIFYQNYGGTNGAIFTNCTAKNGLPSNVTNRTVTSISYTYPTVLSAADGKTTVTNNTCGAGATLSVTNSGSVSSSCDEDNPITYFTVTWDATTNGGTCSTPTTQVVSGEAVGTLPSASKSNYTFNGWFTQASGGTKISTSTIINSDITFYAQFTENQGGDTPTPSGEITWNFSDSDFNGLGTLSSEKVVRDLHIVASSDASITIDANNKTVDGISFTHRLKFGGSGNESARHLWFDVTGNCSITVYLTSSSGSGDARTLNICTGTFGNVTSTMSAPVGSVNSETFNYTGSATRIYLYSAASGINLYGINVVYPGSPTANADVEISNPQQSACKIIREGRLLILRDNKTYDITGRRLD